MGHPPRVLGMRQELAPSVSLFLPLQMGISTPYLMGVDISSWLYDMCMSPAPYGPQFPTWNGEDGQNWTPGSPALEFSLLPTVLSFLVGWRRRGPVNRQPFGRLCMHITCYIVGTRDVQLSQLARGPRFGPRSCTSASSSRPCLLLPQVAWTLLPWAQCSTCPTPIGWVRRR